MKKSIVLLLTFCFLLSCCSLRDEDREVIYTVDVEEAQKNDFCSLFDSIIYIPLETIEGNEIGQIYRVLYHEGKYIVSDRLTNRVLVFDEDGKYYAAIEAIGNGPGEYVQISDVAVDKFEDVIKIQDAMQGKIVSYDLNGRFVGETTFPVFPAPIHFCQVDKGKYAFDFQRCSNDDEWKYNLSINSEDFTGKISKYLPYDEPLDICFSPRITLLDVNGEVIYIPLYSSTIYTIDSLELKPRYSFDFGDKWVSREFIDTKWKDPLEFRDKLNDVNFVYYFNLLESGSHIYAEFMYREDKYHLVIDKETDHLFLQQETEAYTCDYTENPVCCVGNQFVIPLAPSEYNSMIDGKAVPLPEDNNPVLMLVTFKKF